MIEEIKLIKIDLDILGSLPDGTEVFNKNLDKFVKNKDKFNNVIINDCFVYYPYERLPVIFKNGIYIKV